MADRPEFDPTHRDGGRSGPGLARVLSPGAHCFRRARASPRGGASRPDKAAPRSRTLTGRWPRPFLRGRYRPGRPFEPGPRRRWRSHGQLETSFDGPTPCASSFSPDGSGSSGSSEPAGERTDAAGPTPLRRGGGSRGGPGGQRTGPGFPKPHGSHSRCRASPARTSPGQTAGGASDPPDPRPPPFRSRGAPYPPRGIGARGVADPGRPGAPLDAGPRRPVGGRRSAPRLSAHRKLAAKAPAAPRDHGEPHGVSRDYRVPSSEGQPQGSLADSARSAPSPRSPCRSPAGPLPQCL